MIHANHTISMLPVYFLTFFEMPFSLLYLAICHPYPKRRAMHEPNPTLETPPSPAISHVRQPLDNVLALGHTDNRYTRNLPDPPLQIPIVRRHKINPMLHNPLHDTIISISTLVIALQPLPPFVTRNAQRNPVLGPQFLQLGHDAGCDDRRGFGVEKIHQRLVQLEFRVDRVREEVRVDENRVGRAQGGVCLEEER